MQVARDEMERRIKTLEGHIEHCGTQRMEALDHLAAIDLQIEEDKTLAEAYRQVLKAHRCSCDVPELEDADHG